MSGWRVTYVDGSTEEMPEEVDRIRVEDQVLVGLSTRTYGPDQLVVTYVLANVRKWERVR